MILELARDAPVCFTASCSLKAANTLTTITCLQLSLPIKPTGHFPNKKKALLSTAYVQRSVAMLRGRGWGCITELLGFLLGHISLKDNQNHDEIGNLLCVGRQTSMPGGASVWSWVWGRKEKGGDLNVGTELRVDFFWFFVLPFLTLGTPSTKKQEFPAPPVI